METRYLVVFRFHHPQGYARRAWEPRTARAGGAHFRGQPLPSARHTRASKEPSDHAVRAYADAVSSRASAARDGMSEEAERATERSRWLQTR